MTNPVALLIDADNVPAARYGEILAQAKARGEVVIRRAYLDATRGTEWSQIPGLRLAHAGSAKNAADLLMTVEAMELALHGKVERFVLASSDGDFSHLAMRLREYGLAVHGIGETRAPARFREACTDFTELAALRPAVVDPQPPAKPAVPKIAPLPLLDQRICQFIKEGGGKLRIDGLNAQVRAAMDVKIADQPEKTWRAYLLKRPHLYKLDPKGPEAYVRRLS